MNAERPGVKQSVRAILGVVPHEVSHLIRDAKIGMQIPAAPQGKIMRGGDIIAEGKIVTLWKGKARIENGSVEVGSLEGVYKGKQLFLPNLYAGDCVVKN